MATKPPCDRDCFNCPYPDCILGDDDLSDDDFTLADAADRLCRLPDAPRLTPAQRQRLYYQSHRETERRRLRAYYLANQERITAQRRAQYAANRDAMRAYMREYRAKRREMGVT